MGGPEAVIGRPSGFRLPDCNREGRRLKFLVLFVLSRCRFTFKTPAIVRCFNSKLGSTTLKYKILTPMQSNSAKSKVGKWENNGRVTTFQFSIS